MNRIKISTDIIVAAIINTKNKFLKEINTTFEECDYFQIALIEKFKDIGITPYYEDEFNYNYFDISNFSICPKINIKVDDLLIKYLSIVSTECSQILLDDKIMLEILINYRKQLIEREIKKTKILESKLSDAKIMIKSLNKKESN